ncbi:hypothetical protein JVU11DRAFT_8173 [Chiua virens]|nr:hypothetical protein JVU11DRAFT_8173 [Chiua virens]
MFAVLWSATDVLYGTTTNRKGYLLNLEHPKGWFFRHKTFLVTCVIIIDTVPGRPKWVLIRIMAWAALRAGGYAEVCGGVEQAVRRAHAGAVGHVYAQ